MEANVNGYEEGIALDAFGYISEGSGVDRRLGACAAAFTDHNRDGFQDLLVANCNQIDFLHRLEEKITYYRALHDHTDLWVSLDEGPVDGDSVFPVAIEMLP